MTVVSVVVTSVENVVVVVVSDVSVVVVVAVVSDVSVVVVVVVTGISVVMMEVSVVVVHKVETTQVYGSGAAVVLGVLVLSPAPVAVGVASVCLGKTRKPPSSLAQIVVVYKVENV